MLKCGKKTNNTANKQMIAVIFAVKIVILLLSSQCSTLSLLPVNDKWVSVRFIQIFFIFFRTFQVFYTRKKKKSLQDNPRKLGVTSGILDVFHFSTRTNSMHCNTPGYIVEFHDCSTLREIRLTQEEKFICCLGRGDQKMYFDIVKAHSHCSLK